MDKKKHADELWNELLAADSNYLWLVESYKEENEDYLDE
jgi:hypothetical protein